MTRGIAFHGLLTAPIGLGESARRGVDVIRRAGIPVSTHIAEVKEVTMRVPFPPDDPEAPVYDTNIFHLNPGVMLARVAKAASDRRRIAVFHWELPVVPPRWVSHFDLIDEFWAPSRFIAEILTTATTRPIRLVPHPAIVVPIERSAARAALGLPQSRRIILTAFDFRSSSARKNPDGLLRAFRDAFAGDGDAPLLLIKYHREKPGIDDEQIARIRSAPNVHVMDRSVSQDEVRLIYAASDAFVSLHRSEGLGLNILDMMALGRPCIATGYSGNLDFMSPDNSILIPWTMRRVAAADYPLGAGQWWAEPDHDAAVAALRWLGTASDSALAALGERAALDTSRDFSIERVAAIARAAWLEEKPATGARP